MNIPVVIDRIMTDIEKKGFEVCLVGGCVRDFLSGKDPDDYDMATNASPEEIKEIFKSDKVILTGEKHGTVTVLREGISTEVTSYRTEGEYLDKRRPSYVRFTSSIQQDLARRDFTVNAIAYCKKDGFVDPFGGMEDLQKGILKAVGVPGERFDEDALRIIRGLRFSAQKGYAIEKHTKEAMYEHLDDLNFISPERLGEEFRKMLCGSYAPDILLEFKEIVACIIPEIRALIGFDQKNPYHCYDVFTHTVKTVSFCRPDITLRLAALLHDIGKPGTFSLDEDGVGHFYGHAETGAETADRVCRKLRMDNSTRKMVVELVRRHDLHIHPSIKGVKKIIRKFSLEFFLTLLELKRADISAQHQDHIGRLDELDEITIIFDKIMEEEMCFRISDLKINGDDLIKLGFEEGPGIGEILENCLDAVISEKIPNERTALLEYAIMINLNDSRVQNSGEDENNE